MVCSKKIILLRHGSTDYNAKHLMQGNSDIPLNSTGEVQAKETAEYLKDISIEEIYSSPLQRALKTAEKVNDFHNLNIQKIDKFREINMGEWEGKEYFQLREQFPDFFDKWRFDTRLRLPGGESYEDLFHRVEGAVKEILTTDKETVLIVAHSATNRMILGVLCSMDIKTARGFIMSNCGFSEIKIFGKEPYSSTVEYWNRTSHLKER